MTRLLAASTSRQLLLGYNCYHTEGQKHIEVGQIDLEHQAGDQFNRNLNVSKFSSTKVAVVSDNARENMKTFSKKV